MKNTIPIKRNELQQQINLRNHYMGDAAKRRDADADTIQSSNDDEELLLEFTHRACNELVTAVALRFPSIGYSIDESEITITFESNENNRAHLLPMLKQSITDYLTNEVILHWLLLRQPSMAQTNISLRSSLYNNVQFTFAKLYNTHRPRRRCTDLAGI